MLEYNLLHFCNIHLIAIKLTLIAVNFIDNCIKCLIIDTLLPYNLNNNERITMEAIIMGRDQ